MRITLQFVSAITLLMMFAVAAPGAMIDITNPGDTIQIVNGQNQGDGETGPPPPGEGVEHSIDNVGQKYRNFLDLNSGLAVTPSGNAGGNPVTGLRLYTADDAEARDPASFILSGSEVGLDGPWEVIASGNLSLPSERNAGGDAVPTFHQEVLFENTASFAHYHLVFPTLKDAVAADSMQIAEIELLAVPEPASAVLALLAAVGLTAIVRRR